jgi:hypothetical protein
VLRVVLITALGRVLALLLPVDMTFHLRLLPRYLYACEGVLVFGFVGIFLLKAIYGRLLDTGLSRWYRLPAFIVWLLSTSIPFIWSHTWPIGLALFALLLFAGGLIPSKSVLAKSAPVEMIAEDREKVSEPKKICLSRKLSPIGFLRTLLTIGCLGFPMILLDNASGQGSGVWIARLGYFILGIVWLTKISDRLEDAGWSLHIGRGFLIVVGAFLIGILRRLEVACQSSQSYWFSSACGMHFAPMLPPWLQFINEYEIFALFLLIQVPLALLPSKPRSASPQDRERRNRIITKWHGKEVMPILAGPFAFLCRLLLIALLWVPLIYMDGASNRKTGTWIARLGYFILAYAWMMNADGRFEDAGWGFNWEGKQYALVVSVASLMPLAVHWVNGYGALAIFVLIQIPTVFLRSKQKPDEPLPESTGTEEDDACLRDPLGGILVRRADEVGIGYRRPGYGGLTGRGFGLAKKLPRWRRS